MKTLKTLSTLLILNFLIAQAQVMPDYSGPLFPANHALNMPIDSLPVHPNSDNYINTIGKDVAIHPDFGTYYEGKPIGIPYNLVGVSQFFAPIVFEYESDPGPYPIPSDPLIEGLNNYTEDLDGDRHLIVIDTINFKLYETWYTWPPGHSMSEPNNWETFPPSNPSAWWAGSDAIFDLTSNRLRPDGWTSADAAGLPIFPLLIRYDEVERALKSDSVIHHAIRFTVQKTQKAYVWPARHYASNSTDTNRPPMGLRFRLKSNFDISGFSPRMQVILRTMKRYGLILADNGSNWFFQGTHDDRWNDEELSTLKRVYGKDFEAVDITPWTIRSGFDPSSAEVPGESNSPVELPNFDLIYEYKLYQNYPNPFNSTTQIKFSVPNKSKVTLKIYNILGQNVKTLIDKVLEPNQYTVNWNGRDENNNICGSGLYFYCLEGDGFKEIKKMVLIK